MGASVSVVNVAVDLELVLDNDIGAEGCDAEETSVNTASPRLEGDSPGI